MKSSTERERTGHKTLLEFVLFLGGLVVLLLLTTPLYTIHGLSHYLPLHMVLESQHSNAVQNITTHLKACYSCSATRLYFFSLRHSETRSIPRICAAWVRLPSQCSSTKRI